MKFNVIILPVSRYPKAKGRLCYAVVIYRDVEYIKPIERLNFTTDITEVRDFFARCKARSVAAAYDTAEDVVGGLLEVDKLQVRGNRSSAILVHFGDAPAHGKAFHPTDPEQLKTFQNRHKCIYDRYENLPPRGRREAVGEAQDVLQSLKKKFFKYI